MAAEPKLRRCGVDDAELIAELGAETFAETYADQTPAEDMRSHLASAFAPDSVAEELANPDSTFFVVEVAGEAAGFVKLNRGPAQTELPNDGGLEIESLYVLGSFQGTGLGGLLFERALEEARKTDSSYVWLGVWERNERAIRFWQRMGFVAYGSHGFDFAGTEHTDVLMRLDLS